MGLWVHQRLLRHINSLLFQQPLVVHFIFAPSFLEPMDPMSRLEALCGGSKFTALEAARVIWWRLGDILSYAVYIGLWLRMWVRTQDC